GRVLHHWNDTTPLPAPGVRVVIQPRTDAGTPGEQTAPVFTRVETFTDTATGRWSVELPLGMVFPAAPTPSDPVLSLPMPVDIIFNYEVLAGTGTDPNTGLISDTFNVLEYIMQTSITHADTEHIPTVYVSEFDRVGQYVVTHP
ncbi:MAG: hypothetical protein L3J76_03845, partial [Candidatus Hydrothermae bacterium]|nr:hypothetical protein [Candidatus Hydrothermae bacterium]